MQWPDEAPLRVVVLLQQDAAEGVVARAVVPLHAEQPAAAVVVVEQRGVEAAAVQVHRIRTRGPDGWRSDGSSWQGVLVHAEQAAHVGVDEVEDAVAPAQAGCPDAARVGLPAHLELAGARVAADRPPVPQVARVVQRTPGHHSKVEVAM